ncbi:MAG: hypothetical protein ACLGI2_07550 [Acidimicrobiia bacterium]
MRRLKAPSLESLFVAVLVLLGFRLGVLAIADNSMFTHLRTGIDIAAGEGIPRSDPYSYTAGGTEWVVQSWLPEWTYGWLYRLADMRLVVFQQAILFALLAWLVCRLAKANTPVRTAASASLAVALGAAYWSPRPLLFGLICMALTVTVVERRRTPWLLVPIVWLWVNSHGSFPLGLVWLGARAAGEWLDWKDRPRETARYIWGFLAGLGVAVLNPLGARLLLFPLTLGEKRTVFDTVREWQSPNFHAPVNRLALVLLAVIIVLLLRARLTWRDAVPSTAFLIMSLYAVRNIPLLAIVLAPVLARILKRPDYADSRPRPTERQLRLNRVMALLIGLMFVIFGVTVVTGDPLNTARYPEEAATWMEVNGLLGEPNRLAHQDFVGNYLELRYGRAVPVFIDDRIDMYPAEVSTDYLHLLQGRDVLEILDRYGVTFALWEVDRPLPQILGLSADWQEAYRDDRWVIYRRLR